MCANAHIEDQTGGLRDWVQRFSGFCRCLIELTEWSCPCEGTVIGCVRDRERG